MFDQYNNNNISSMILQMGYEMCKVNMLFSINYKLKKDIFNLKDIRGKKVKMKILNKRKVLTTKRIKLTKIK